VRSRGRERSAGRWDRSPPSDRAGARPGFEQARALAPIRAAVYSLTAGCSRALFPFERLVGEAGAQMSSASLAARVSRFGVICGDSCISVGWLPQGAPVTSYPRSCDWSRACHRRETDVVG
jgi:hypothetical protein